jgi:hypothetical protein
MASHQLVDANCVHDGGFHSHFSDATGAELLSLIGDEFLEFEVALGDGKYFSFILRGLEGRRGGKGLVPRVQRVSLACCSSTPPRAAVAWEELCQR